MNRRPNLRSVVVAVLAILVAPLAFSSVEAQVSSRYRVVVPNFNPQQGADRDFGEDVADELRGLLDDLATHRSVDDDDIEDEADRFDIDMEDLNCVTTRQLVNQTELGQVIFCGEYTPQGGQYAIDARIIEVTSGETVELESFTVAEGADSEAARHLFDAFDRFVQLTRAAQFCSDYYQSDSYDSALEQCSRAVELNPDGIRSRFIRGLVHKEMENLEQALEDMRGVLEVDPVHEDALQWAGWLAITMGDEQAGRDYYRQYLELNPTNASVRMNIAYDMAQQGDPEGAMILIDEGLELDEENLNLWQQLGNFALSAASSESQSEMTAEAAEYYRTGIDAYQRVLAAQDTAVTLTAGQLRAMISAYIQLDQLPDAIETAEEVLEQHPDEPRVWGIYADALQRSGDLQAALEALDRVRELDPDYPNLAIRQGRWLLAEERFDEALPYLRRAVEDGSSADQVGQQLLSFGHSNGVQQNRFNLAINAFETAKEFDLSDQLEAQINFWHGWSLFKMAEGAQEPQTLETARRTLPWFQQARQLLQASRAYVDSNDQINNLGQILNAVSTYIEIQEAIIQRGR